MQLTHYTSQFNKKGFPVVLVCDHITNAPNIGGLFRIADAFNIQELVFCAPDFQLGKRFKKTSRATENAVKYKIFSQSFETVKSLKERNYKIIALEITKTSIELTQFQLQNNQPIALIIGDEKFGVSEDILQMADTTIHINMYGQNSSMNVVQATSIALYELTKQLNS